MDRKSPEKAQIERLIQLSATARGCLSEESAAFRRKLDIPSRLRNALSENPTSWLFGSVASGLAASLLLRRKPSLQTHIRSGGLFRTLLGLVLTAVQPMLRVWLTQLMSRWAASATAAPSAARTSTSSSIPTSPISQTHVHSSGPRSR